MIWIIVLWGGTATALAWGYRTVWHHERELSQEWQARAKSLLDDTSAAIEHANHSADVANKYRQAALMVLSQVDPDTYSALMGKLARAGLRECVEDR